MTDSETRGWKSERPGWWRKDIGGIYYHIQREYIGMDTYIWHAYRGNEELEFNGFSRRCACEAAHKHAREKANDNH